VRRRLVTDLRPGDVLGQPLFSSDGDVLLAAGVSLTSAYVDALRARGFVSVYVRDGLADDVAPADVVSVPLRTATAAHVARVFTAVGEVVAQRPADRLAEEPLPLGADAVDALYHDIESLLTEALEQDAAVSLESLKSHNTYTFDHSVDVAVIGILIGRQARLGRDELRELALGALLHDLGKMYVDVEILDKPGKLTTSEFDEIKRHPRLGFELIRRLPIASILPAHVAYQHHERQDGGGYPRGLVGTNRIARTALERFDPDRMLLIAEIAAVADVYSAIASDRPYRPAMPPDEIVRVLRGMARQHLNGDVVALLLRTVPPYPVGHWVEVTAGPQRGWRGVVTAVSPDALDRPRVRLLVNEAREATAAPVEIDLRDLPEVAVACLPAGVDAAA
jgi:HD-GYP domain-containing protein (c-di-GMP phosphodiesterase class II)